jgi:hypothetical protein
VNKHPLSRATPREKEIALLKTAEVLMEFVAICLLIAIIVACIWAPLDGNWVPDIAVGSCAGVAGIGYLIYRFFLGAE